MNYTANDFPAPHIPPKLPLTELSKELLTDTVFVKNCINANKALSQFIGYLHNLPNPNILISALTVNEAVESSKIEGTIATIEDVLQNQPDSETIKNDIKEISNYIEALKYAFELFNSSSI